MFRLYDMSARELIIAHKNEDVIYNTVINYYKKNPDSYLYIIKRENKGDAPYIAIRNEKDLEFYKKMYEYRKLTNMSCIELKREILDLAEKPKVKTLSVAKKQ